MKTRKKRMGNISQFSKKAAQIEVSAQDDLSISGTPVLENVDALPVEEETADSKALVMGHTESYPSPVPHPDILQKYKNVVPDAAERLIRMAEKEQDNRHAYDKEKRRLNKFAVVFGMISAVVIIIACLATIVILGYLKVHPAAIAAVAAAMVSIVIVLITRRSPKKQ